MADIYLCPFINIFIVIINIVTVMLIADAKVRYRTMADTKKQLQQHKTNTQEET